MSLNNGLHCEGPQHMADDLRPFPLRVQEDCACSVAHEFHLRLRNGVLVMSTNATKCKSLFRINAIATECVIVKPKIICVIRFDFNLMLLCDPLVSVLGRDCLCACCSRN